MGESAGGYLAALIATTNNCEEFEIGENLNESSSVQAAIDIYGLSDLTKIGGMIFQKKFKKHMLLQHHQKLYL